MMDSERFIKLDRIELTPSIAFKFIDDFTSVAITNLTLTIRDDDWKSKKPVRSPSGFFIFYGLNTGTYAFHVEADGYDPWEQSLAIPSQPVLQQLRLTPSPSYDFPTGSIIIRGMVYDGASGNPVSGASIHLPLINMALIAKSSQKGEFVLYLSKPNNGLRVEVGDKWYIKGPAGDNILSLTITAPNYTSSSIKVKPVSAQQSPTEFIWELGKEIQINNYLT